MGHHAPSVGYAFLLVAIGLLVTWSAHLARERGRNEVGWAFMTLGAGAATFAVGILLIRAAFLDIAPASVLLAASLTPIVGGLIAMFASIFMLYRLPTYASARGSKWPVFRVPIGAQEGLEGFLRLATDGLQFEVGRDPAQTIPYADVLDASVDCECLRIQWRENEARFLPTGGPNTHEWKQARSEAILRRIQERRI